MAAPGPTPSPMQVTCQSPSTSLPLSKKTRNRDVPCPRHRFFVRNRMMPRRHTARARTPRTVAICQHDCRPPGACCSQRNASREGEREASAPGGETIRAIPPRDILPPLPVIAITPPPCGKFPASPRALTPSLQKPELRLDRCHYRPVSVLASFDTLPDSRKSAHALHSSSHNRQRSSRPAVPLCSAFRRRAR